MGLDTGLEILQKTRHATMGPEEQVRLFGYIIRRLDEANLFPRGVRSRILGRASLTRRRSWRNI